MEDPNREAVGLEPIWRADNVPGPDEAPPIIATLTPNPTTVADPTTITVGGTGFLSTSVVEVDGVAGPTTFVDETALTFERPAAAGTYLIVVKNGVRPSPGIQLTVTEVAAVEEDDDDAGKGTSRGRKAKS